MAVWLFFDLLGSVASAAIQIFVAAQRLTAAAGPPARKLHPRTSGDSARWVRFHFRAEGDSFFALGQTFFGPKQKDEFASEIRTISRESET